MNILINTFYYVVPFLVVLGVLVFVHEFGHFLIARLTGVKVDEFSIGFGKKLWGWTDKKGTLWKVCALPLGGYVKMFGDADASSAKADKKTKKMTKKEQKVAFDFQPPSKKLLICIAGPLFNYLFAILIFAGIFFFVGKFSFPTIVGEVMKGGAAESGGVLVGDKILALNGKNVSNFDELRREVALSVSEDVKVDLLRGDKPISLSFPLKVITACDCAGKVETKKMLGVISTTNITTIAQKYSFIGAFKEAGLETWRMTEMTLRGVGQMITGKRGGEDVGGIIRIAEMSGDVTKSKNWIDILIFTAMLSINLGLINLFPIPVLDGGHIVIYVMEIVSRRKISEKVKEWLFKIGLFLILALMIFATWNDFVRLFRRWFS